MIPSQLPETAYAAVVALDWCNRQHAWAMSTSASSRPQSGWLINTPEAIDHWAGEIAQAYPGGSIAVVLEQNRGPVAAQLAKYAHLVLCPVHPSSLALYRKTFRPSGAKDDPSDATALLDLFFRHPDLCPPLKPDSVETRTLQFLVEDRRKFVDEQSRLINRLTDQLKRFYPQILTWFGDIATPLVADFLTRWPTLRDLKRARQSTLRRFFYAHRVFDEDLVEKRLAAIAQAVPAVNDEAVLRAGISAVRHLLAMLEQLRTCIADYNHQIATLAKSHPDYEVMRSFPGAGDALAPRLIAALGTDRSRFPTAQALQNYTGISPVVVRSGRQCWTHYRHACPRFVRQTIHEWAMHSIPYCQWARDFYQQQRARGKSTHVAVRALAFKWLRILFRCWQDHTPYSDTRYQQALAKRQPTAQPSVQIQWTPIAGFFKLTADYS